MLEFWFDPENVYFRDGKLGISKEMTLFCVVDLRAILSAKSLKDMRFGVYTSLDDFLYMVTRQDRIADYAQNVAEQLSFRELYDSKIARENLIKMASIVVDTVMSYENTVNRLKELSNSGFSRKEKDSLLESIRDVNLKEHLADKIESIAAAHVFSTGDGDALAAMHMYRVLQRLDDVANACEKAANAFLPSLNH